ncbi:serine hydrolase domain-containing protein [Modestobacter excelsi]|uniref:serine hydrolase domain-containing protein n=1 Tax=Modestobacter excelsi TaxID=2213161 RepID=UPI00110C9BE3|nr:serine hydrolase domain-containing protein [Modestobacter excelsi]
MADLEGSIDRLAAETGFSGVVRVDRGGRVELAQAYGLAHRGWALPTTVDTRFAVASGTKGLTALTVASLVEEGRLALGTRAREVLGEDLPLIDDRVTVEHLLAHRSGIGDYVDEDAMPSATAYVLPVPVHRLVTTEDYLAVLDGYRQAFPPGERFAYNNSGFVVLALIAERVEGAPFADLVRSRVCDPAGMADTEFLRSDEPTGRTALGYLDGEGLRTNVLHLPVRGSGDGGVYTTAADVHSLWSALDAGRIVPVERVADMVRPRSDVPAESMSYGLGFWLHRSSEAVVLEGADAGVSFRTVHDRAAGVTHTVLSNTTDGAWPMARHLQELLTP